MSSNKSNDGHLDVSDNSSAATYFTAIAPALPEAEDGDQAIVRGMFLDALSEYTDKDHSMMKEIERLLEPDFFPDKDPSVWDVTKMLYLNYICTVNGLEHNGHSCFNASMEFNSLKKFLFEQPTSPEAEQLMKKYAEELREDYQKYKDYQDRKENGEAVDAESPYNKAYGDYMFGKLDEFTDLVVQSDDIKFNPNAIPEIGSLVHFNPQQYLALKVKGYGWDDPETDVIDNKDEFLGLIKEDDIKMTIESMDDKEMFIPKNAPDNYLEIVAMYKTMQDLGGENATSDLSALSLKTSEQCENTLSALQEKEHADRSASHKVEESHNQASITTPESGMNMQALV